SLMVAVDMKARPDAPKPCCGGNVNVFMTSCKVPVKAQILLRCGSFLPSARLAIVQIQAAATGGADPLPQHALWQCSNRCTVTLR
ncbi:MAG TPA: hypothetical protein VGV14_17935, partial [Rhodanobacter sp.]|nr:hypothetical protein [Rhodanobacter sp.]